MSIKNRTAISIVLIITVVLAFTVYCVLHYNKKLERQSQIRNLIYSSLPNVMSDNIAVLCRSNAVTSAELFVVSDDRVFLCYDIDGEFYCIQQTGQLLRFQVKEFAIKAMKPQRIMCLYNIDKSVSQSPDGISMWMQLCDRKFKNRPEGMENHETQHYRIFNIDL